MLNDSLSFAGKLKDSVKHSNIAIFIPHSGCPNRCSFCNQNTISGSALPPTVEQVDDLLSAAVVDLKDRENTQIAFFGGSFTAIDRGYMLSLLEVASGYVKRFKLQGIRISTRPDCIDDEVLQILQSYNVTAIELGVQSLDDRVLALNDRGHTLQDVYNAVSFIKKYKFSLGLQMMVGLYGDTKESLYFTADTIIKLNPDTARIYPAVILKGTKLCYLYEQGEYIPLDLDTAIEYTADIMERFIKAGIRIIKVGLHASTEVESQMVGGIYHPAFRELCEGRIYLNLIMRKLQLGCIEHAPLPKGSYTVYVNGKAVSKAVGQKRVNFNKLYKLGYRLTVRTDNTLSDFVIRVCKD